MNTLLEKFYGGGRKTLFLLLAFCVVGKLYGGTRERYRPKERHYAAVQLREECSVRRAVLNRIRREKLEKFQTLKEIQLTLRERREALEKCVVSKGLNARGGTEDSELRVAEACGESYDLWLTPGYHIEIVERETYELERTFEKISNYLSAYCGQRKF